MISQFPFISIPNNTNSICGQWLPFTSARSNIRMKVSLICVMKILFYIYVNPL